MGVFAFCFVADKWAAIVSGVTDYRRRHYRLLQRGGLPMVAILDEDSPAGPSPRRRLLRRDELCLAPNTVLDGKLFTMVTLATGNLQKCAKMLYYYCSGHGLSEHDLQATRIASAVVIGTICGVVIGGLA